MGGGPWGVTWSPGLLWYFGGSTLPPASLTKSLSLPFQTLQLVPLQRCPEEAEAFLQNLPGPLPTP